MKPTYWLMTVALLPMCSSFGVRGQDTLPATPAPDDPTAVKAARPAHIEAEKEYDRAVQQAQQQTWVQLGRPSASGGGRDYVASTPAYKDRLQRIIARAPGTGANPMIIRSASMDPKDQANLAEDLAVMAHILNKTVDEIPGNRPLTAMGIDVFAVQGPVGIRSVYLEGYGALFTANVGFPLVAVPPGAAGEKKEESAVDSTWEEAKQELYGQPPGAMVVGSPVEEFSTEKVAKLSNSLVEALKNATNIRGLKSEDSVTVCVVGAAALPGAPARNVTSGAVMSRMPGAVIWGTASPQNGTVMTIRAKKADVDAFAKGKLTLEEFRKQVRIEKYEAGSPAGAVTGFGAGGFGGMGGGGGYGTRF